MLNTEVKNPYIPSVFSDQSCIGHLIWGHVVSLFVVCIKLDLKPLGSSLVSLVLILARFSSSFTFPDLPLQWSPNTVTSLWVPFYFVSFLAFSAQNIVSFLMHCFGC